MFRSAKIGSIFEILRPWLVVVPPLPLLRVTASVDIKNVAIRDSTGYGINVKSFKVEPS